jgi:hypothetical protein
LAAARVGRLNTEIPNRIEAIQEECARLRVALTHYEEIGAAGAYGAHWLKMAIQEGEASIASGDVLRMVEALTTLRTCE